LVELESKKSKEFKKVKESAMALFFWACPAEKGGSRLSLQSFLAEKAKKGFPLQPLTQATQKSEKFQLNQSILFRHSEQVVVASDYKNQ
jgi:hypothetical protein